MKTVKSDDATRIVKQINETRRSEHFRNPDRPDAMFVRPRRGGQDPEVIKAQTRLRTAHYRNRLDQRRAPSTYEIGMAMVIALVTSDSKSMSRTDWNLVGRAMADLQGRGYDLSEVKASLRKLRNRMVDPANRAGEPGDSTRASINPTAQENESPVF